MISDESNPKLITHKAFIELNAFIFAWFKDTIKYISIFKQCKTKVDDFAIHSRENGENNASKGSNSPSNWSKPEAGKIRHADAKNAQNGLNEPSKAQSVTTYPSTSVISNSNRILALLTSIILIILTMYTKKEFCQA